MQILKSKNAGAWARRVRCFLVSHEDKRPNNKLRPAGYSTRASSPHSHKTPSPQAVQQDRSLANMFLRRPRTPAQTRRISTSSSPSQKQMVRKKSASSVSSVDLHNVPPPFAHMKLNPFVLNSNGQDLRRFLEQVGTDPKEARYWLQQFQQTSDPCSPFAIVQVENEVFDNPDMLDRLGSCLSFLQRNDMKCVVIHGNAIPINQEDLTIDLQVTRTQLSTDSMMLVSMLESHGTLARPFFSGSGIIQAQQDTRGSHTSLIEGVSMDAVKWALRSGHIPVLQSMGETSSGQIVGLDLGDVTAKLAAALQPRKVLFINAHGGFVDNRGEAIPNVNLPLHWEHSPGDSGARWTDDVHSRVKYIANLLTTLPQHSSVVITSATSLLTELFTHHGSGTFFKITEPILMYKSIKKVDVIRLRSLINRSFGKDLNDDYFHQLQGKLHTLYLSKDYNAAAVVTVEEGQTVPYLDKFAVSQAKQGEGTGEMLWECLKRDYPSLCWRSKVTNKINPWYFKHCDGTWSNGGDWMVFWYGVPHHKDTSELIDYALALPSSFEETGSGEDNTSVD